MYCPCIDSLLESSKSAGAGTRKFDEKADTQSAEIALIRGGEMSPSGEFLSLSCSSEVAAETLFI